MPEADRETGARAALAEITPTGTVGELLEQVVDDGGVVTLRFAATMAGYPGWRWTVSLAELPGEAPSVLETELMPGEGALIAPDWVPWADGLEDWRAAQLTTVEVSEELLDDDEELDPDGVDDDGLEEDEDDDDLDEDDDDLEELDEDDLGVLRRGGGRDGIEIDFLDDSDVESEDSGLLAVGEDEQDEAEAEADEDSPEPPDSVGGEKLA